MMMRMLEAGGMPVLVDNRRQADIDNPRGYYEFERVKALREGDKDWLEDANGKAVKVISALLEHLPSQFQYKVIFMVRRMEEILASQRKMLARRQEPAGEISDEQMARLFDKHLRKTEAWLASQSNVSVLEVDYNALVADPHAHAQRLQRFLGGVLDPERMAAVVEPELYRNRTGDR